MKKNVEIESVNDIVHKEKTSKMKKQKKTMVKPKKEVENKDQYSEDSSFLDYGDILYYRKMYESSRDW